MLSTFVILFRESLEIALILGVLLAATRNLAGRMRWIGGGVAVGVLGALVIAVFAGAISAFAEGMGQEIFNACILLSAAALIGWTTIWMSSHSRDLTAHLKSTGAAVVAGSKPRYTLAAVAGLAVLREGSEIVLFLYGVFSTGQSAAQIISGSVIGLLCGTAMGLGIYYGLVKISPKHLFGTAGWLLVFVAAGMAAQASELLTASGLLPDFAPALWNTSSIISERSIFGQILHVLIGYSESPGGTQIIAYLTTVILLGGFLTLNKNKKNVPVKSDNLKAKTMASVAAGLAAALIFTTSPAFAAFKVYSPNVEQGELEIEAFGNYDFDSRDSKDGKWKQNYAVGYGVTDRWYTEVVAEIEHEPGEKTKYEATEWENRFQLTEQGEYWIDLGLYLEFKFPDESGKAEKIEGKLLLEKQFGEFVHRLNLTLEQEIGKNAEEDLEGGIQWATLYRVNQHFEPGFEYYADFGVLHHSSSFDEQSHLIGPVVRGKIGDTPFSYEIGYLFGLSDAAQDGSIKWVFEFEHYF